jgi:hypothetical protein
MLAWAIKPLCEALVRIDQLYLVLHPKVPLIYQSGVRYKNEPKGQPFEEFAPIPTLLQRGWGDCDDLAPWRAAELRTRYREHATIRVQWKRVRTRRGKEKLFHIVVRRANGAIEDPSRILGMR